MTTNEAPTNLLFQHRNFRVRLPELTLSRDDSKLRATDNENKQKIKSYSDQKKTVKQCDIAIGDTVLVKMEKRRKTDPFYDPYPLTVINKKGNMIEARRGTKVVTRNSSFFKKVKVSASEEDMLDDNILYDNLSDTEEEPVLRRSIRVRGAPVRYPMDVPQ